MLFINICIFYRHKGDECNKLDNKFLKNIYVHICVINDPTEHYHTANMIANINKRQ